MAKITEQPSKRHIAPLNMNKLQGRMLRLPPVKLSREILFVYGHHSSLERYMTLAKELNKFGAVTIPDLPGLGGMENMFKIGEVPSLDSLADYLASFIKLRYKRRRLTIVGWGFGFLIITRMLQRYPDIVKKIDMVVSLGGFVHYDDIFIKGFRRMSYRVLTNFFCQPGTAFLASLFFTKQNSLRSTNSDIRNSIEFNLNADLFPLISNEDINLWKLNDIRTHLKIIDAMLVVDNCKVQVNLPVWHVSIQGNTYLHESLIEQHLQVVYGHLELARSRYDPSLKLSDPEQAIRQLLPSKLRHALSKV
jgi:pimeloyl-ACP methyl ester carboxylesterase